MKRRTPNNMTKATKMITAKGYGFKTANEIAIHIFDQYEQHNNGMPVEWYIDQIITKEKHDQMRRETVA